MNRNPESYFRQGLPFFIGVVEDTADPMQMGRVRVRCIGYHPERADGAVPTDHLPWAYVMLPTTASGVSGIGSTHGLVDGSWVAGYFLDGRDAQQPFVIGSFVGAPGLSRAQTEAIGNKQAISSSAPGPQGGNFQTALASAIGGLGAATKFGSTVGSIVDMLDVLKNDDLMKTIGEFTKFFQPTGSNPVKSPLTAVIDKSTSEGITRSASQSIKDSSQKSSVGREALARLPDAAAGVLSAGGAKGFEAGETSPLSSASFGSIGPRGEALSAQTATLAVKTNYDFLAGSAPENTGVLTVYSTQTPKLNRYTIESLKRDEPETPAYDYVIDQSGQVIKIKDSSKTVEMGGSTAGGVGVALIGGAGDGPLDSKFFPIQLQVLENLVAAFARKFPKIVITGQNEVGSKGSPGFNVSEWARTRFPQNVNTSPEGQKRLGGTSSETVGATTLDPNNLSRTDAVADQMAEQRTVSNIPRGFQGGLAHPVPSYAARRESDVPALARTNALTAGRGTALSSVMSGGPSQQYLAQIEEPSQWGFSKARKADTLEARAVPETWQTPKFPHGGEYNQTHVVRSTEGGHHIVLDDTNGRQKVEVMHSSGSMLQIQADGSGVFYLKKDGYEVVLGDKKVGINGSLDMEVGGDMRVTVKGDLAYDVTGKISFNGASSMHELIRGDRTTVTEGSHLFQAKKNAVHKVGKDLSVASGGKTSLHTRGARHDVVDGNRSDTTRGESSSYVGGNRSALTLGSSVTHSQHVVNQSTGEMVSVAKGNMVNSAKGRMTVVAEGVAVFESKGESKLISGGKTSITSGAAVDVNASGAVNVDGSTINLNSGLSSAATGADTADVDTPPAQLTRESNIADSAGNLDAEQVTQGDIDKLEAIDESGIGGTVPGSIASSGGASGSDSAFNPVERSAPVTAGSLGNSRVAACDLANDLVGKGWSQEGAAAIVGNMRNESNFSPTAYNPNDVGQPAAGLIQWRGSRLTALQSYAAQQGLNWQTREAQIGFLDQEARTTHAGLGGAALIAGGDIEKAILAAASYERFAGWDQPYTVGGWESASNGNRAGNALAVYNECFGKNVQSVGGQVPSDISGYTGGTSGGSEASATGATDYATGTVSESTPVTGVKGPYATGGSVDWGMKISPNFTLGQLCPTSKFHEGMNPSGRGNISSQTLITNLSGVAVNVVEVVMARFGKVHIVSGYRSLAYNTSKRGARNSDHMTGQAVDLRVPGVPQAEVADWIERNIPTIAGIGRYPNSNPPFTHVSFYLGGNQGRVRRW